MARNQCPDCQSRSGLAEYQDGTFCHSCKKYTPGGAMVPRPERIPAKIPEYAGNEMPKQALEWLQRYFGDQAEGMIGQDIYWGSNQRIVFKYRESAWMRSIDPEVKPKWLFSGDRDLVWWYRKGTDSVVLTEDVVSAYKVADVMDSIALGGTHLKQSALSFILEHGYKNVYIMLDGDKAGQDAAYKIHKKLGLYVNRHVIKVRRDPKEHSLEELQEILGYDD